MDQLYEDQKDFKWKKQANKQTNKQTKTLLNEGGIFRM